MGNAITCHVGLDTSKDAIVVYAAFVNVDEAVEFRVGNLRSEVRRMVRRLKRQAGGLVSFCYEAGAFGYELQRWIRAEGAECVVVAPSLIPRRPGERVKTDRRDAKKLCELFRAGLLTEVHPPTPEEEAARDLIRGREDLLGDLRRCRQRIKSMLLRRGLSMPGSKGNWTLPYRRWLRNLVWDHEADRLAFGDYLLAFEQAEARMKHLEAKIKEISEQEPWRARVGWLRCLRGVDTLTAMTLLTELHGSQRFCSPRELMSFLGLVPSENSSGGKVQRGGISHAGNRHGRRVLIEAAHHYAKRPAVRGPLKKRREGQPEWVLAIADEAQLRLHRRFWRLLANGKARNKVVTAVARELAGFIWAILQEPGSVDSAKKAA
jgi:transposase